jgi:predicted transcriptional regulator of viral defense system
MPTLDDQIHAALEVAAGPLSVADLRRTCRVRTATLCETLSRLTNDGRIRKAERGYLPMSWPDSPKSQIPRS